MKNDKITSIIEKLADKLGTTAEKLFSVLVKQASIASVASCFYSAINILVSIASFASASWFFSQIKIQSEYGETGLFWCNRVLCCWDNFYLLHIRNNL
jgi:hypothetical protein